MTNPAELWMQEYGEASKVADEARRMLSEHGSHLLSTGPETQRHLSAIRRRITILSFRLDKLETDLSCLPKRFRWFKKKEILKWKEMLSNIRERERQMTSVLNMWHAATSDEDLVGSCRTVINLQGEIMREQDEKLDRLYEVLITKQSALLNGELNMHTRLIDNMDQSREPTDDWCLERVQKGLKILNKAGCSCICLLPFLAIIILAFITWMLAKYLKGHL